MNRFLRAVSRLGSEDGLILPLVLALFVVGMLLIAPTLGHGYTSLNASQVAEAKAKEVHAADSGIEAGLHALPEGIESLSFFLNDCHVDVTIVRKVGMTENSIPIHRITSTASGLLEDSETTVETYVSGILFANLPPSEFQGTNTINVDAIVEDDFNSLAGNVTVNSTVLFMGEVKQVSGNLTVNGTVIFYQYVDKFTGSASSSGTAIFCGGLGSFSGSASSSFKLVVATGDLTIQGASASLAGTTIVLGDIHGGNNQKITGDLCCPGTIDPVIDISGATRTYSCGNWDDYCLCDEFDLRILSYTVQ